MNKKLLFSLLLAGTAFTGHADEARLLRFPATNGSDIVFSYAGDLYKAPLNGGEAQKLTSHIGYEMFARFSPDGKSIAFTGQYDGNTEVYLIPTDGGEPQFHYPKEVFAAIPPMEKSWLTTGLCENSVIGNIIAVAWQMTFGFMIRLLKK